MLRQVKNGDTIVVDGRDGHVIVNPDPETLAAYPQAAARVLRSEGSRWPRIATSRPSPPTAMQVELLANINSVADAKAAAAMGATGVGLFRTEYLFLTHPDVPDEEEQLEAYREIIAASPNQHSHDPHARPGRRQDDSLLGPCARGQSVSWAGDRFGCRSSIPSSSPRRSAPFCAPAADGPESRVRMMFPMITTLEEIRRVRTMVRHACARLEEAGQAVRQRADRHDARSAGGGDYRSTRCWKWSISCRSARTTWCSI